MSREVCSEEDHNETCDRCLACRIAALLGPPDDVEIEYRKRKVWRECECGALLSGTERCLSCSYQVGGGGPIEF